MIKVFLIFAGLSLISLQCKSQETYKNPSAPVSVRVSDLIRRMTPEEKFWQLFMLPGDFRDTSVLRSGIFGLQVSATRASENSTDQILSYNTSEDELKLAKKINSLQKHFVEHTRLGIPMIAFDEALHGLVRGGATVFPQSIGLAATFDTALMTRVAVIIAEEARARGIRQVLSPVVNIASDVRWGRVEETYGEDPFLASAMGVAYVTAFEERQVITTPKHLIANSGDGGRDSYPIHWNERLLREVYWPPFRACLRQGRSRSVMASYNSVDGIPAAMNPTLLTKTLKGDLSFSGFVVSDANAPGGANVLHMTSADYATSGQQAVNAGLDVIFQTSAEHYKLFQPPFLDGRINPKRIDDAVARVLKAKFELGLFENPYVSESQLSEVKKTPDRKALARQAARESIVLLKNSMRTLPLKAGIRSIAVIGQDATDARLGGYSGPGTGKVNILEGIRQRAGNSVKVSFSEGCGRRGFEWKVVPATSLFHDVETPGLNATYFSNVTLGGTPAVARVDSAIDFHWTLAGPDPLLQKDFYSARWTGKIKSPETGIFKIGLSGNDGFRLYIDDRLIVDRWKKQTYSTDLADFSFIKGKAYNIRVEFYEPTGGGEIRLVWNVAVYDYWRSKIDKAVALAGTSDAVIVVAGIVEGEFQDRALLSLPGHQEELIRKITATGKPVVVVLIGGSAIVMSSWLPDVAAVLDAWYPGEEGGHAVADVLWGDYDPAGRLPITFPQHEGQLPLVYNHKPTGRGDDYNDLSGLPLFPFGFGLSYTTFQYDNVRIDRREILKDDSTVVRCTIKNTGTMAGDEVVQLYLRDELASVARPVLELKAFQRLHLAAGESREVAFKITPVLLAMLNEKMESVVEPGEFSILIGASSRDVRLKDTLTVKE